MLDFCGEASSSAQSFGETVVEGTGAMTNSWLLLSPGQQTLPGLSLQEEKTPSAPWGPCPLGWEE